VVAGILKALRLYPWCHAIRQNSGKRGRVRFGEKGLPDIQVLLPNERTLWIEVKRPGGKGRVSDDQERWHAMAHALRHTVIVVESVQPAIDAVRGAVRS